MIIKNSTKFANKYIDHLFPNMENDFREKKGPGVSVTSCSEGDGLLITILNVKDGIHLILHESFVTKMEDVFGDKDLIEKMVTTWFENKFDSKVNKVTSFTF